MSDLEGYAIPATDGDIGHVKDFYFDDTVGVVRDLVVDIGTWLSSRIVLISPGAIGHLNLKKMALPVSFTKAQVKSSPDIATENPAFQLTRILETL